MKRWEQVFCAIFWLSILVAGGYLGWTIGTGFVSLEHRVAVIEQQIEGVSPHPGRDRREMTPLAPPKRGPE